MDSGDQSYVKPQPKKYQKISQKTKKKLIQMVQNGMKILSAAKVLKIKDSTAKMIIKKYRERGDRCQHPVQMVENIQEKIERTIIKETQEQKLPQNHVSPILVLPYYFPYMNPSYFYRQCP